MKKKKTFKELFAGTGIEPTTDENGGVHYNFNTTLKNESMKKEFIPYEQALALKELGFDELCFGWYDSKYQCNINYDRTTNSCGWLNGSHCSAPTFSQAFRWFREKYGLDNAVLKDKYVIETQEDLPTWYYGFNTPEEAELACLRKLIEIVKNI
jgi:hypothetical protein